MDLVLARVIDAGMLNDEQAAAARRDIMKNLEPHRAMADLSQKIVADVIQASLNSFWREKP